MAHPGSLSPLLAGYLPTARRPLRKVESLRNLSQYNDLTPFIREQELIRELVAKSMLPSLTLDISDNNISAAVERIADWLEQSGGLYMPD